MKEIIYEIKNTNIKYYEEYLKEKISTEYIEKLFELFRDKENFIRNKEDNSHEAIWFGPVEYKYSNYPGLKEEKMPEIILLLGKEISKKEGKEENYYNSVYINKYIKTGMGKHHDNDSIFKKNKSWNGGKEIEVAVYSLGESAKIFIYERDKGKAILEVEAKDNSLYIMGKNFQNELLHRVGNSKGVRYSLTFRNCIF